LTKREEEILGILSKGVYSPTLVARDLGITQSGATQALQKLERKGVVKRTRVGRNVLYRPVEERTAPDPRLDEDLELIRESCHALSKVWSHVLKLDLSHEELKNLRQARNLLEEILVHRGKDID
jgi:DNA-binding MarR family transcriptional regulator